MIWTAASDFQAPLKNAWMLKRAWPDGHPVVVDEPGTRAASRHAGEIVRATGRFAALA